MCQWNFFKVLLMRDRFLMKSIPEHLVPFLKKEERNVIKGDKTILMKEHWCYNNYTYIRNFLHQSKAHACDDHSACVDISMMVTIQGQDLESFCPLESGCGIDGIQWSVRGLLFLKFSHLLKDTDDELNANKMIFNTTEIFKQFRLPSI